MLTRRRPTPRRGFTLIELLVAMVVGGVVLSLLTLAALRQQRLLADLFDDAAVAGQLREAAALLPIDLRALSVAGGDVREARDTSLELRNTIATAVVCDIQGASLVLPPATSGGDTYASYTTPIEAGDTAWLYTPVDLGGSWRPHTVMSVTAGTAGQCAPRGPRLAPDVVTRARVVVALDSAPGAVVVGRPLRVTRVIRLSLYRSADGTWNVGERDWNPSTQRFNSIQPLAGPFLPASSSGLEFAYLDSARAERQMPFVNASAAAAITFTLRGETHAAPRVLGPASQVGKRLDSARVVVLLRNRR